MYLELIFTGIKTGRWKVAEVSKIAGLKHVGKIFCVGIQTSKAGRMRELKYKSCRAKIVYRGTEGDKKYCLCRDWNW